ncbi:MAG: phage holin family protein [Dehalococcoidia bacterium]|nr:phage holin family protein [Dehalococcoidia bacterium]
MSNLIVRLLVNAAALIVADYVLTGISFDSWLAVLLTALVFGVVNAFIRPLVQFVTCLISAMTLGLFTLIINTAMLYLTYVAASFVGIGFRVDSLLDAFLGAIIITVASFVLTRFLK